MTAAGGVGPIIADISLPSYPTVGLWQSVTKAYMAMRNGNSLYIVDFDNTGFRTTGLAFLRVLNTSLSVDRIDAAAIIYSNNLSNNFINNKLYDFKQVVTLKWVGLGNNLFSGLLAPYH
jgi:hypothetical protein